MAEDSVNLWETRQHVLHDRHRFVFAPVSRLHCDQFNRGICILESGFHACRAVDRVGLPSFAGDDSDLACAVERLNDHLTHGIALIERLAADECFGKALTFRGRVSILHDHKNASFFRLFDCGNNGGRIDCIDDDNICLTRNAVFDHRNLLYGVKRGVQEGDFSAEVRRLIRHSFCHRRDGGVIRIVVHHANGRALRKSRCG